MDPLVSVIVPVYNVYPFLQEALDSVIGQTYTRLEILLVDDGSTDGSGEICEAYAGKDPRVRVIHQNNLGISAARNRALDTASGEILAFMDPDDSFDIRFIEELLTSMMREDADVALCKYDYHYTTGHMTDKASGKTQPRIAPGCYTQNEVLSLLVENRMNHSVWNKLYKKKLWDSVRFHEDHVIEDLETTYKVCSSCKKICVLKDVLYHHRKRSGSITSYQSRQILEDELLAYDRTESYVRAHTPSLFSNKQLSVFDRLCVQSLLSSYPRSKQFSEEVSPDYRENLRKQIIEKTEKYDLSGAGLRLRTGYKMICRCPKLYDICYSGYMGIRMAVFKVRGR
ncbi:MAG: glycosyltransferase [Clostridiales bacterium]|nr:glycosyltransferase [Clostridiales bacterium]